MDGTVTGPLTYDILDQSNIFNRYFSYLGIKIALTLYFVSIFIHCTYVLQRREQFNIEQ